MSLVQMEVKMYTFWFGSESPLVSTWLWKLGALHDILGENEEAMECYRKITTTVNGCRTSPRGAPYFRCLGRSYLRLGRYEDALHAFEFALKLKRKGKDPPNIDHDLSPIVATLKRLQRDRECVSRIDDAVLDLERRGFVQNLEHAKCWTLMGRVLMSLSETSEAIRYLEMALEIHLANEGEYPWSTAVAKIYEQIGDLHHVQESSNSNSSETALANFHKAIDVCRRSGKSDEHPRIASLLQKAQNVSEASIV